jgi:signal transduction histidine kinase
MFKSVFAKYLTAFALIILVSFFMLASIVTSMVRAYASDAKEEEIGWIASSSREVIRNVYHSWDGSGDFPDFVLESKADLKKILDAISNRDSNLSVFITDEAGKILLIAGIPEGIPEMALVPDKAVLDLKENGEYFTSGTLGDLYKNRHLIAAYAVAGSEQNMVGSVFVCSSSAQEDALISIMTETIIMASLWVMLAAMIAVYFISDRIIGPLHSMKNAAKQFARGDFEARVVVSGKDEIAELGAAFNSMAQSLEHLETMRNSFLANVSHDLRTPMTTISGFIDGINSGAIPPEKHSYYLNIISGEVHRLSRLVSQLLDISKLESGDRKFVPAPFDVCETARLILISFEQRIEEKRLDILFETDADSMIAYADKDSIHQVMYNLCENAIKFSREEGMLRISIKRGEKNKLVISVYNEGAGIPREDLPLVFDRFYKSDKSRGLDKNGVGLGLYIVKTIVEAQGESISVQSEPGEYCEFDFTLEESDRKPDVRA